MKLRTNHEPVDGVRSPARAGRANTFTMDRIPLRNHVAPLFQRRAAERPPYPKRPVHGPVGTSSELVEDLHEPPLRRSLLRRPAGEKVSRPTGGTDEVEQPRVHRPNSRAEWQVETPHKPSLRKCLQRLAFVLLLAFSLFNATAQSQDIKQSDTYRRLRAAIDRTPAIDTHDHPMPFELIRGRVSTPRGFGMTLHSLWSSSYYTWFNPLTPWPASGRFDDWWPKAKHDFDNARATSFYRYQLPAFQDLYHIDFEAITDDQARELNDQIFDHYQNPKWLDEVVTERANIELMFIDPYWARFALTNAYRFAVPVLNVTTLISGTQPAAFPPNESLTTLAREEGLTLDSLDGYLAVIDRLMIRAKAGGAVCLKTTSAYSRSLDFSKVPKARAEKAYGRARAQLSVEEQKDFEDFIFWQLVELSARHELPFQIHTGHARIQGSNPMLLVDVIAAHPRTKFILFHGGYPWVGETGAIATRHSNVWIDSVWLPTISYTMAKRAYQEWLEVVPSNHLLWGADAHHAEGIYAATDVTRRCLAEALAEKVERKELRVDHAERIGRQVMRENALELFPQLKARLWRKTEAKPKP